MTALGRFRAISLTTALAVFALLPVAAASAADGPSYMKLAAGDVLDGRPVYLGVNKSVVVDLPKPAGDVLVSNPRIADAVLRTSTRLYLIGVELGQASVFLFDNAGGQIASFNIYVDADLTALNQLLAEAIPDGYVRAEALQGSIVLRGQVLSAADAARAVDITKSMIERSPLSTTSSSANGTAASSTSTSSTSTYAADSGPGIINLLNITGSDQVALKVTIAEVQREVTKQLGIDVSASFAKNNFAIGTDVGDALDRGLSPIVDSGAGTIGATFSSGGFAISAVMQALDETHMLRTLAEPTLIAVSGETANFLAGGEFGYRVLQGSSNNATFTTEFKPFGVQLAFTPVVLSGGRISIKVRTSVSEISDTADGIPSLTTRRAETTVEQPSGGAFVIGGLLQQNTQRVVSGFPGLQRLPILGALFSSKNFLDRETELVIIVTPYLVKPTAPSALARPDRNMAPSSDAEAYFLNRLTKVYGTESQVPGNQVGFTFD